MIVISINRKDYILYLDKKQVIQICKTLNPVKIIREAFKLHGRKEIILPDEAYLSWVNRKKESARSLNMPAFIGGKYHIAGTKIINGNIFNYKRGLERASGLTLLFDSLTARIICIMEGSYISSLRTAAVTALGINLLKKKEWNNTLAIIGLGTIGKAHLDLLSKHLKGIKKIYIYDLDQNRITSFLKQFKQIKGKIILVKDPQEAVTNSDVVITATTTTTGYIPYRWLKKGALVVHVSLDDLLPDAILKANKLIVDDWNLVKSDNKRIVGRMFNTGKLTSIYGEISEIVLNKKPGRETEKEIIIFNPFGMSIDDITFAYYVYKKAIEQNIGKKLNR